jgi:hypothetical protein
MPLHRESIEGPDYEALAQSRRVEKTPVAPTDSEAAFLAILNGSYYTESQDATQEPTQNNAPK